MALSDISVAKTPSHCCWTACGGSCLRCRSSSWPITSQSSEAATWISPGTWRRASRWNKNGQGNDQPSQAGKPEDGLMIPASLRLGTLAASNLDDDVGLVGEGSEPKGAEPCQKTA